MVSGCESREWGKFREAGIVNHSISPTNRPHKRRLFRRSDIGCGGVVLGMGVDGWSVSLWAWVSELLSGWLSDGLSEL